MRASFAYVVVLFVALIAPAHAGAQTEPTLDGEMLSSTAAQVVEIDCDAAGTSTAGYTMTGTAIGPFPGTFTETGTYSVEGGQVTSFEAAFTIESGLVEIHGTKTLSESISGVCDEAPEAGVVAASSMTANATYTATISSPLGTFSDAGTAPLTTINMLELETGSAVATMQETFVSAGPELTTGHVTGGGYLGEVVDRWVSFGFNVKSDGTDVKAQCSVVDHATGTRVRCLNANLFVRSPTHATFSGEAVVNGDTTTYTIDVDDFGEPGAGDTFEITTGTGFTAAGVLSGGNIQIHE